jgi:signal transduction histidine kinase
MTLDIIALCVFIFGAYAYGAVLVLTLRHRSPAWTAGASASRPIDRVGMSMLLVCTAWFALNVIMTFGGLVGATRNDNWIDLLILELTFVFPGLIFHTVLSESRNGGVRAALAWRAVLLALYGAGAVLAVYIPAAIFGLLPRPGKFDPFIGISIGSLFMATSIVSIAAMLSQPRQPATRDRTRLRQTIMAMFVVMIGIFVVLTVMREKALLIRTLDLVSRATPLAFLLVSVYFESRIEFYDLVVKRGVILLLSLLILAGSLALDFQWLDRMPPGSARAWLFAVLLLPAFMWMPWLHDRVGRLLDRLWFGREFAPGEAVTHVLAAMQRATDEPSLVGASEATLSEIFHRPMTIVLERRTPPPNSEIVAEISLPGLDHPVHVTAATDGGVRPMLSEDRALVRSLSGVFAFMLANIRLQRKRQEQEQLEHELRLQTSQSELKALRAQINPHFLFNALNAIASLIHTDPARADAAVEQLAEVFRYTLRRSEQEWAPLDQELDFAQAYLDVEQARFGRRLDFSIEADPKVRDLHVPAMLLQTLVENAVKHGISRLRTPGRIDIRATRDRDRLRLEVRDTGPGLEPSLEPRPPASGESFGLRNVRDRLRGHFGADASLELFRQGATTVARLQFPLLDRPAPVAAAASLTPHAGAGPVGPTTGVTASSSDPRTGGMVHSSELKG